MENRQIADNLYISMANWNAINRVEEIPRLQRLCIWKRGT